MKVKIEKGAFLSKAGKRLEWLRQELGFETAIAWAQEMGGDQSAYSKVKSGERGLPKKWAFTLVMKYGLTLDFLYHGSTKGLSPHWLGKLLATPEGIALIEPSHTAESMGMGPV